MRTFERVEAAVPGEGEDVVGPWLRPLVRFLEAAGSAADGVRIWELEVLGRLGEVTVYRHVATGGCLNVGADGSAWRYVGDGRFEPCAGVDEAVSALSPPLLRVVR